jgi:hypothetical protein
VKLFRPALGWRDQRGDLVNRALLLNYLHHLLRDFRFGCRANRRDSSLKGEVQLPIVRAGWQLLNPVELQRDIPTVDVRGLMNLVLENGLAVRKNEVDTAGKPQVILEYLGSVGPAGIDDARFFPKWTGRKNLSSLTFERWR